MKLTDKLDLLMNEKGINRAELARESGIPYTTISSFYDKGTDNVKLSTLRKLADYFDCSLDYLVDDNVTEKKAGIPIKPTTVAAHLPDGVELTEEEQQDLDEYIQFILSRRKK
jgi:DNA-binding Xre family transcriptional regulator